MDTALITDARQIMRSRLRGRIPSPSHFLCRHRYLYAWNSASCLPAPAFHLLMIRAVFSASDDNVLSALWEISVFWRDSFGLVRNPSVSLSIFISVLPPNFLFFPGSLLSFYPTFLLTIPSHSLFLYLTCLSRFFFRSLPEESGKPYLSFAHSPHFKTVSSLPTFPLPPSLPPAFIHINAQVNSPHPNIHSHCFPSSSRLPSPSLVVFFSLPRCTTLSLHSTL